MRAEAVRARTALRAGPRPWPLGTFPLGACRLTSLALAAHLHRAGLGDRRLLLTGGVFGLAVRLQRGAEAARDVAVGQGVGEGRPGREETAGVRVLPAQPGSRRPGCSVPLRVPPVGLYGAPVSNVMPSAGGDGLPVVDEVLAAALTAQGEPGVRALGLLRGARRILAGTGLERPDGVAESCLRGAADALLSLPDALAAPVGLKSAVADLLDAVPGVSKPTAAGAVPAAAPRTPAGPLADTSAGGAGTDGADAEGWARVCQAAEVLRGQLKRPGGLQEGGRRAR